MTTDTKEDKYISFTSTFKIDDGTEYESWVYKTRIIKTGKYKVGGHITVFNPEIGLYNIRDRTTIKDIGSEELAEKNLKMVKENFKNKILEYADVKKGE